MAMMIKVVWWFCLIRKKKCVSLLACCRAELFSSFSDFFLLEVEFDCFYLVHSNQS